MLGYSELIARLKEVKKLGYVRTHRKGPTGIGKTLEDLLGITENNIPGPNAAMIELKSARKNTSSMLTLFTKSPLPKGANTSLLQKFGYAAKQNDTKKRLETTVNALEYNQLKGQTGFKAAVKNNRINLLSSKNEIECYWDKTILQDAFTRKLPKLLYVKAETKGIGASEEFWFNEAWLLSGFSFENFIKLLLQGVILIDIRIGQYADGRTHDHGTGFRIRPDKLDLCFSHREKIV